MRVVAADPEKTMEPPMVRLVLKVTGTGKLALVLLHVIMLLLP